MLLHDCQIITNDMLLTSSHLHVALYIGSLAMVPWRGDYHDPLSPPAHVESGSQRIERLQGAIIALAHRAPSQPCHVESVPLRLFPSLHLPFLWSGDVHTEKTRSSASGALTVSCQLAVPAVTVEIHLSADVPYVWQRVAVSSILKGLPWPRGTGSR